jgi:hypothetical protein
MGERFHGGSAAPAGYYLNPSRWAIEPLARDGDRLPPGPGEWRRIPMVAALLLVPILGVTFLMFMPVAGFVVLGQHLWKKARAPFVRTKAGAKPPAAPNEEARGLEQEP